MFGRLSRGCRVSGDPIPRLMLLVLSGDGMRSWLLTLLALRRPGRPPPLVEPATSAREARTRQAKLCSASCSGTHAVYYTPYLRPRADETIYRFLYRAISQPRLCTAHQASTAVARPGTADVRGADAPGSPRSPPRCAGRTARARSAHRTCLGGCREAVAYQVTPYLASCCWCSAAMACDRGC